MFSSSAAGLMEGSCANIFARPSLPVNSSPKLQFFFFIRTEKIIKYYYSTNLNYLLGNLIEHMGMNVMSKRTSLNNYHYNNNNKNFWKAINIYGLKVVIK